MVRLASIRRVASLFLGIDALPRRRLTKTELKGEFMKRNVVSTFLLCAAASALVQIATAPGAFAALLEPALASFAVLGASTVTNTGATTLTGDVGVSAGSSITGQSTLTVNGVNALLNPGDVHLNDGIAILAQGQLTTARTNLGLLGPGTTLSNPDLSGLTLTPGVYTVAAGVSNLTTLLGALTLDGQGDANAFWLFQMPSTLITSSGSVVNVINTGAGAGVFWNVGSSATLDTTTSFQGNILALTSITLNTGATIGCGRALADVGAVTMDANTISTGCLGTGEEGSNGLSGGTTLVFDTAGNVVDTGTNTVVAAPVPEPGTLLLLGSGIAGFVARRLRSARRRQRDLAGVDRGFMESSPLSGPSRG